MRAASALARPTALPAPISVNGCAVVLVIVAAVTLSARSPSSSNRGEITRISGPPVLQHDGPIARPHVARLPARPTLGRAEYQFDLHRFAIARCVEVNRSAGRHRGNYFRKVARLHEGRAVDRGEYVALFDTCALGRAARFGPVKDGTVSFHHAEALGES